MDNKDKRNLYLLVLGSLISLMGSGIQMIALPLYILDLTNSGTAMGLFSLASILPALLMTPVSGVVGDRFDRRKVMIAMDLLRGIVVLSMAVLIYVRSMTIYLLFAGQVLVTIMNSLFVSSSDGILPDLVKEEDLQKANGLKGSFDSLSNIFGPILGGIIYGVWGMKAVFAINAVSFFLSALFEFFIVYQKTTFNEEKLNLKSFVDGNIEVFKFLLKKHEIIILFFFAMLINLLLNPLFDVVIPYTFRKVIGFSAQQYGFLQTFFVVGLLIGNILMASFLAKAKTKILMTVGGSMQMGLNLLMGLTFIPNIIDYLGHGSWKFFVVLGALLSLMGLGNAVLNIPLMTNFQKMVSSGMRSRFFALLDLMSQIAVPIGSVIYGLLLDRIKVHYIFITVSFIAILLFVGFILKADEKVFEPGSPDSNPTDPEAV